MYQVNVVMVQSDERIKWLLEIQESMSNVCERMSMSKNREV